jgi:hypothetical protein
MAWARVMRGTSSMLISDSPLSAALLSSSNGLRFTEKRKKGRRSALSVGNGTGAVLRSKEAPVECR